MKRVLNSLKNWIDNDRSDFIRTFLLSEGFGFCLFLSFFEGYCLDKMGGVSRHLLMCVLLSILLGDVFADVVMIIMALKRYPEAGGADAPGTSAADGGLPRLADKPAPRPAIRHMAWITAIIGLIIFWIPVWLAYYPAVFAYDAETQLGQVISGPYSTHHPLLHTLIMGGCMKLMWSAGGINAGMALYAFLQMLFMAVVFGWVIAEAYRRRARRKELVIYGVFLAVFPAHAILAISTTKDVIFSALLILDACLILRYVSEEDKRSRSLFIKICAATAFLILFRNNAMYAVALCIAVLALGYIFHKDGVKAPGNPEDTGDNAKHRSPTVPRKVKLSLLCMLLIGCAAGCIVNAGLKAALHAESGSPREALSIPIQQMARTYVLHRDELPADTRSDLETLLGGDVTGLYNEHLADPVKRQVYMKEPARFVKTWARLAFKYRGDYLDAWLYTTEGMWYIRDTSVNRIYGEGTESGFGYLSTDIRPMPYGFEVVPRSFIPGLKALYEKIISDNAFEKIPIVRLIFSPAMYVWIFGAYIYVSLLKRNKPALYCVLLPVAVGLTLFMGPAVLVRYAYPYMLLTILPLER